jgi:hypothetical protein
LEGTCTAAVPVVASSLTAALTIRAAINAQIYLIFILNHTPSDYRILGRLSQQLFAQLVSTPSHAWRLLNTTTGIATSAGIRYFLEISHPISIAKSTRVYEENYVESIFSIALKTQC